MGSLDRFVEAQADGVYERALSELRNGEKRSHWMWFVFPQIAGLARSETAHRFAIADRVEAERYLGHPLLGGRLDECSGAMLAWSGRRTAEAILGAVDALKFRSSMTLFEAVSQRPAPFGPAIEAFYAGARDPHTLERL
ncbi:MAG: DUF1810 domain-containing protein [Tsuneonella sp.]